MLVMISVEKGLKQLDKNVEVLEKRVFVGFEDLFKFL